jgi:hypothetical protein
MPKPILAANKTLKIQLIRPALGQAVLNKLLFVSFRLCIVTIIKQQNVFL